MVYYPVFLTKTQIHTNNQTGNAEYTHLIPYLAAGIIVLFICCLILGIKHYQAMTDNATLQYQNACFTAESVKEKTFAEIYNDLSKIIKETRQIN